MLPEILTNFTLSVDGKGYVGVTKEVTTPKFVTKMLDYNAGGLAAPLSLPAGQLEQMELEFTIARGLEDMLALMRVIPGESVPFTLRGAVTGSDGETTARVYKCRGLIKEIEPAAWKPGEEATIKVSVVLDYCKVERDGTVVVEVDAINMVCLFNGVDQLQASREALGI